MQRLQSTACRGLDAGAAACDDVGADCRGRSTCFSNTHLTTTTKTSGQRPVRTPNDIRFRRIHLTRRRRAGTKRRPPLRLQLKRDAGQRAPLRRDGLDAGCARRQLGRRRCQGESAAECDAGERRAEVSDAAAEAADAVVDDEDDETEGPAKASIRQHCCRHPVLDGRMGTVRLIQTRRGGCCYCRGDAGGYQFRRLSASTMESSDGLKPCTMRPPWHTYRW